MTDQQAGAVAGLPPAILAAAPRDPAGPGRRVAAGIALAGVAAGWLLGDGFGLGVVLVAVALLAVAAVTAVRSGRRLRTWNVLWAAVGMVLVGAAAWRGEERTAWLGVFAALALGSLALHGGATWRGVLWGQVSALMSLPNAVLWGWRGVRRVPVPGRRRMRAVAVGAGTAAVLVAVFAALFGSADPAFAHGWGTVLDRLPGWSPAPALFGLLGAAGALTVAHSAAAPWRWDRYAGPDPRPRGRLEWLIPLLALDALFAAFDVVQVSVLFGGYRSVLRSTHMSYADYARQGFWQLLAATVLTLAVVGFALRWAPRATDRDRLMVTTVLGTLCGLALVVVGSALRRMQMDIDAYGLTRPRVAVVAIELWLGIVFLLLLAARCRIRSAWLPRAVVLSAAMTLAAYSVIGPDALIARYNVDRSLHGEHVDRFYLAQLDADAAPDLDRLPEPLRSCVLAGIADQAGRSRPWYATTFALKQARDLLARRPLRTGVSCPSPDDSALVITSTG